ncbi:hypothetical protein AAE478_007938 [Parahypoxylon ruwenzoriense]
MTSHISTRLVRSTERESRRCKRYSLRIEFLDDDDAAAENHSAKHERPQRQQQQQQQDRQTKRSGKRTSGIRSSTANVEIEEEPDARSRRSSVCSSTDAVIGTGSRQDDSPVAAPQLSHKRNSSRAPRQRHSDIEDQLAEYFARQASFRDRYVERDERGLPQRFARQMSLRDQEGPARDPKDRKQHKTAPSSPFLRLPRYNPNYTSSSTQTDSRYSVPRREHESSIRPPILGHDSLQPPRRSPGPNQGAAAATSPIDPRALVDRAYNDGFLAGQRMAAAMAGHDGRQRRGAISRSSAPTPVVSGSDSEPDSQPRPRRRSGVERAPTRDEERTPGQREDRRRQQSNKQGRWIRSWFTS